MTTLPDAVDDPIQITSSFQVDDVFLAEWDARIRALGGEIVTQRGLSYAWCRPKADPDGDTIPRGCGVAVKPSSAGAAIVQPADAANIGAGAVLMGITCEEIAPGSRGRVAVAGLVPPSVTGLGGYASNRYARANASTGALEAADYVTAGDAVFGILTADGGVIMRSPTLDSTLTLTITDNVTLTEDQSAATLVVLTGSPAASYVIEWVDAGRGTVVVVNNTGHAHRLAGADVATHVAAAGGVVVLFRNGTDIRAIGGTRDVQTIVGSGGTTAIEGGNRTVVVDVSAAGHTVQLPDPVAINDRITVKAKGNAAAHNLVISHGGSKIDGSASGTTINTFGGAITFESDLNNWWIVARA